MEKLKVGLLCVKFFTEYMYLHNRDLVMYK